MPYNSDDYLDLFARSFLETETPEERIEAIRHKDVFRYRVKTIRAGKMLECEIYPIWNTQQEAGRAKRANQIRAAQQNLNDKNTKKRIIRLTNNNFDENDIWATFTYDDEHLPATPEEAQRNIINYLRRIKHKRMKLGLPPLRYIYVTEFKQKEDADGDAIRFHHHVIMSGDMDRDEIEKTWKGGARREAHRLQPDEFGLTGLACYISKAGKGKKRWGHSQNLKMPKPTIADKKLTKRKAEKMVMDRGAAPAIFEKFYAGYIFNDIAVKHSDFVAGVYIYVRMHREDPPPRRKGGKKGG